jgi:HEAT repeat protein
MRCIPMLVVSLMLFGGCSKEPRARSETPAPVSAESVKRSRTPSRAGRPAAQIDAASVAVLEQAIDSKDYATRLIAIEAVGDIRADMFLPWLERALGDPEHDVRMATVDALRRVGSPRAFALLKSVREDTTEELDIRALAAAALLTTTP